MFVGAPRCLQRSQKLQQIWTCRYLTNSRFKGRIDRHYRNFCERGPVGRRRKNCACRQDSIVILDCRIRTLDSWLLTLRKNRPDFDDPVFR